MHTIPSFVDIKSPALKAKDSAVDTLNNARDRYQVSTANLRLIRLYNSLTSGFRRRTVLK